MSANWLPLGNTIILAVYTCLIACPLGGILGGALGRRKIAGARGAQLFLAGLFFVPLYVTTAAWEAGFGVQGWLTPNLSTPLLAGWRGAAWVHAMHAVPVVALIVANAIRMFPRCWDEQIRLDSSSPLVWTRHAWPYWGAALMVAAIWIVMQCSIEITVTDVFQIRTFAEEVYIGFARDRIGQEQAFSQTALTILTGAVFFALLLGCGTYVVGVTTRAMADGDHQPPDFCERTWGRPVATGATMAIIAILVMIPVACLIYKAGIDVRVVNGERLRQWSGSKVVRQTMLGYWQFRREYMWSFAIAQLASLTAILVSMPLAVWGRRPRWRWMVVAGIVAGLWVVPGPVIGIVVITLMNQRSSPMLVYLYDQTIAAPWLALTIRIFPMTLLLMWFVVQTVPRQQWEAAQVDGAGWWTCVTRIVFGQRVASVMAVWLLALAVALGDLSASILVVPPGLNTLAIRTFGLIHYGVEDQQAAVCLGYLLLLSLILALAGGLVHGEMIGGKRTRENVDRSLARGRYNRKETDFL
ncbi:MAG: ABC transporter permease subunit [Pirellulaceae bacterium]|nr:iron ABC transporter permease [Planctomycetales bacterium]